MSQFFTYPATTVNASNPSIGVNGSPAPGSSTEIGFIDGSGDLQGVSSSNPLPVEIIAGIANPLPVTDAAAEASLASIDGKTVVVDTDNVTVIASALPTGAATSANQATIISDLGSILANQTNGTQVVTGPLTDTQLRASAVPVSAASLPLPSGAATAANQATEIASLASIDSKLTSPLAVTGPLTDAQLRATPVPVSGTVSTGGLTDAELRASPVAVSAASLPLPSGAATEATLSSIDSKLTSPITVTGPLTDTQLRATPVPVSGTVTITPSGTQNVNVTNASIAVTGTFFQATQPVSGTVAVSNFPATQAVTEAGRAKVNLARNDYSSTNVTTGAYVQLIASTSATSNMLEIFDSSGQTLVLAVGAAASEVDQMYINPGGNGQVPLQIPSGSRVSIKAVTATASSGYINLTLYS